MRVLLTLTFLVCAIGTGPRAFAALGEKEEVILKEIPKNTDAVPEDKELTTYHVYEMRYRGTKVKQYAANGVVFAFTWSGGSLPQNFASLLGSYLPEYQRALKESRNRRIRTAHLTLKTENLVVETSGHAPALHGKAYVPALIPSGMQIHEMQ